MQADEEQVRNVPEAGRYELAVDGHTAIAAYQERSGVIYFSHTEVPPEVEGQGVGSTLARGALDDVRQRGLTVVPSCAFIASFIKRHEEYHDLVHEDHRGMLER